MTQDDRTPLSLPSRSFVGREKSLRGVHSAADGELLMLSLVGRSEVQDVSGHDMRQDIEI